jgi:peptidyl-prolyl cis-trans isomerase C
MTIMRNFVFVLLVITICLLMSGCGLIGAEPTPTPTVAVPTPTMEPMAAIVNGEGITIVEYQAELDRYVAAVNETGASAPTGVEPKTLILDELINTRLLSQAAVQSGFQISEVDLENRLSQLAEQIGGVEALQNWQNRYAYSDASLRQSLQYSLAAAWMRDKIISGVPLQTEQVHARQILLADEQTALAVKAQLDAAVDFTELAYQYDSVTGGDLGWFPRGYLNIPEVETIAFSMEVGEYSAPVRSDIGWHIIQLVEKDPVHGLSPDALLSMQHQALNEWLLQRRAESTIDILI